MGLSKFINYYGNPMEQSPVIKEDLKVVLETGIMVVMDLIVKVAEVLVLMVVMLPLLMVLVAEEVVDTQVEK